MDFTISNLITPAIIISVAAFLVHFFGKIISDAKPFADDRGWVIQLSGVLFLIGTVMVPSTLGIVAGWRLGNLYIFGHWLNLFLITICLYLLWRSSVLLGAKIYQLDVSLNFKEIKVGEEIIKPEEIKKFFDSIDNFSRKIPLQFFIILFAYILTLEYKSNNFYWIILDGSSIFISLILIAYIHSLNAKLPQVDIIFINKKRSILDVTLLKVNKDNVRIKKNGKVTIINKDQVEKIEIIPSKESLKKD